MRPRAANPDGQRQILHKRALDRTTEITGQIRNSAKYESIAISLRANTKLWKAIDKAITDLEEIVIWN